ncbi:MAG: adenosylcobalamin-dependent ribonucleoside-diphosphate reductase [Gammaproteobacteria bacterium]
MKPSSESELSHFIWEQRYRDPDAQPHEKDLGDTWKRVARAASAVEQNPPLWTERFLSLFRDFRFIPGGRILAGAGAARNLTLANCFVMGAIEDSVAGIFEALKEGALTIQQGGGVGYDFSTLRPRGSAAQSSGTVASGPISFMRVWDAMCAAVQSTTARRGAMMATLRCDHPDIEAFIDAKRSPDELRYFNLSVQVTEQFMQAVLNDGDWPLVFPDPDGSAECVWSGSLEAVRCRVHRVVRAREIWKRLCNSAYDCAEPGVLFIDRINGENNLAYCEQLTATNPCAEAPLPAYGACPLGSINLAAFVLDAFTARARLDEAGIRTSAREAVRFLDDIIEICHFPLMRHREQVNRSRRLGLGVTGLADALAMLGLHYDSEPARATAALAMRTLRDSAYEASVDLGRERGSFPAFDADAYLSRPFIRALPAHIQNSIARYGIRNSHLIAIAPAGSISLLANNVSSGIEPMSGIETFRRVLATDATYRNFQVTDLAYAAWRLLRTPQADKPASFVEAEAIAPRDHLLMQAAVAPFVDGSISKVISLPQGADRTAVAELFEAAHLLGLKGCTIFSAGSRAAAIARRGEADHEREALAAEYCSTAGRASD